MPKKSSLTGHFSDGAAGYAAKTAEFLFSKIGPESVENGGFRSAEAMITVMDDIYYDMYNEGEAPVEESKTAKVLRIIMRAATVTVIVLMFAFFFYRMWEMKTPRGVGDFLFNAQSSAAYDKAGNLSLKVKAPYNNKELYTYERENLTTVTLTKKAANKEDYETVTLPLSEYYEEQPFRVFVANTGAYYETDEEGNRTDKVIKRTGYYEVPGSPVEGALRVSNCYFIPSAGQVQLTFRYKSDVLEKLDGKQGKDGSLFIYTLSDGKSNKYTSYGYKTAERGVYRYITMVFDGVNFSSVTELTLTAEYLASDGTVESLAINVYDSMLENAVSEVSVSKTDPANLAYYRGEI